MQQKNKNNKLANFLVATGNITMATGFFVAMMFGCTDAPTTPAQDTTAMCGAITTFTGAFIRLIGKKLQEKNK